MSSRLLSLSNIVLLAMRIQQSLSEPIDCANTKPCGPCNSNTDLCQLSCKGFEACEGGELLTCQANQNCHIECNGMDGGRACKDATINAQNALNVSLDCKSYEDCKAVTLYSGSQDLSVQCTDCQDMTINAILSSSTTVNCESSCKSMNILCGDGDCFVNCNGNDGTNNICEGMNIFCGTGHCQINCTANNNSGQQNCNSVSIDTSKASQFTCIGSIEQCGALPDSFTRAPTLSPNTYEPTLEPTLIPTTQPTTNPTLVATMVPTAKPSMNPTVITPLSAIITTTELFTTNTAYPTRNAQVIDTTVRISIPADTEDAEEHIDTVTLDDVDTENWIFTVFGAATMLCFIIVICMVRKWSQNLCNDYRDFDDIEGRKHTGMSEGMSGYTERNGTKEYLFFEKYDLNQNLDDLIEEEHHELDEIDNLMIGHNDDHLIEDIDNMDIMATTGSNHFVDLDMKISDATPCGTIDQAEDA